MFYKLGRAGGLLEQFGAVDFATTIAPGVRDVLLTGKVYEAVRRRRDPRRAGTAPAYDAVVLDAPPTGRVVRFLNVNHEVAGLAKVGPIRSQADSITAMMHVPQTVVHVVTLLEEMPVQETVDAIGELPEAGFAIGGIVVNQVREPLLPAPALAAAAGPGSTPREVTADLEAVGMRAGRRAGAGPADPGARPRRAGEPGADRAADRARAGPADLPAALPADGIDANAIRELADAARRPGDGLLARTTPTGSRGPRTAAPPLDIDALIGDPAPASSCAAGPGGVGKTTTAAALGAARGRGRAARSSSSPSTRRGGWPSRSASPSSTTTPRPVTGIDPTAGGSLDAMMLDMKRTFDEVVARPLRPRRRPSRSWPTPSTRPSPAPSRARRSTWRWRSSASCAPRPTRDGTWDLIVVDTPPSRSALDFLDAPAAARVLPRRPVHPAADRRPPRPAAGPT